MPQPMTSAPRPSYVNNAQSRRDAWSPAGNRRSFLWMTTVILALYVAGFALLASGIAALDGGTSVKVFGWGTGIVAFTLGIRHAFDADHITAIDNTTRALGRRGQRPVSVGFFFALGHCTVVLLLTVILAAGAATLSAQLKDDGSTVHQVTGLIGPIVSGLFMLLVGAFNAQTLWSGLRLLRSSKAEAAAVTDPEPPSSAALDEQILATAPTPGPLGRILRPVLRRVTRPGAMYPVGFLFGLGFDTATEIGLLVVSATAAASGLPWWAVLALPLLFAAGMTTFDTADGVLMQVVYGWSLTSPRRTLRYNLTLTGVSCALALIVAIAQLASAAASGPGAVGRVGAALSSVDLGWVGYTAVGAAVTGLAFLVAIAALRRRRTAS